jgi:hypothetical protein
VIGVRLTSAGLHADHTITVTGIPHGPAACGTSTDQV